MRFVIVGDTDSEAKLDEVFDGFADLGFRSYFAEKQYDDSELKIAVILMCRNPSLKFKQRIRFSKKENTLYMDVMLDFEKLKSSNSQTRKQKVAEKLLIKLPQIISKYKFKDFDLRRFSSDLRDWFKQHHWILA